MGKNILVLFIALSISFLFLEGVSRLIMPIDYGYKYFSLNGKEKVGINAGPYLLKRDFQYRQITQEFDALTTHTNRGFRGPDNPAKPKILFIGDSMTYGIGLSDEETVPHLTCKALEASCANLGIPGASTIVQLNRLEHFLKEEKWRPRHVIFMPLVMTTALMAGNDLSDNLMDIKTNHLSATDTPAKPVKLSAQKNWKQTLLNQRGWILEHINLARITYYMFGPALRDAFSPSLTEEELNQALSLMEEQLRRLDQMAKTYGFRYMMVLLHPMQDVSRGTWTKTLEDMEAIAPDRIDVLSTAEALKNMKHPSKYYFPLDGHFTPEGATAAANYIAPIIRRDTQ